MPALRVFLVLILAAAIYACSGTPLSPSAVSSTANGAVGRAFDEEPAEDAPAPTPPPATPAPDPEPGPAPAPAPASLMVSIISSFGPGAYLPNPLWDVAVGTMLQWVNEDRVVHHIVLEDGTDLGVLIPGQSSAAVPLTAETTSYYCRLHPTMFGTINRMLPPEEDDTYPDDDYGDYYGTRRRQR